MKSLISNWWAASRDAKCQVMLETVLTKEDLFSGPCYQYHPTGIRGIWLSELCVHISKFC